MSLISFIEQAGEKLFARLSPSSTSPSTSSSTPDSASPPADLSALNATAAAGIKKYIDTQGLKAEGLQVQYDGATQTVTVSGAAPDQATKEKIVLCCGNVSSVAKVDDQLTVVKAAEAESTYVTVKAGDTLSKISKDAYGDANKYPKIFDANKPMLNDPNKIYPGQVLRIPAA